MSRRVREELLDRFLLFSVRILRLCRVLDSASAPRRLVDQLVGSGTSPGAQMAEADEAMSDRDYLKSVRIALKELGECRYWLRLITDAELVPTHQLEDLIRECDELRAILRTISHRTKDNLDQSNR